MAKPTPTQERQQGKAAGQSTAVAQRNGPPPQPRPLIEPEPDMWKRYSPHHEFPLSAFGSVVLHFLAVLMAAFMAVFVLRLNEERTTPTVDNVVFAGGGGSGEGGGDPNATELPEGSIAFDPEVSPETAIDAPIIDIPDKLSKPTSSRKRLIEEQMRADRIFKGAARNLRPGDRGRGGTGTGGGKGSGHGTGEGSGSGPGKMNDRMKRMDRWVLSIRYNTGEEYIEKLADLDAILVVPEGKNKFRIFRNLRQRPPKSKVGSQADVSKLNRLYWRNDDPEAMAAIGPVLGLSKTPPYVWAFFPQALEKEMLRKELAFSKMTEKQLEARRMETIFSAEKRGSRYVVRVIDQRRRTRR